MLALENSTDEAVYKQLAAFNKLILQYTNPVFTPPRGTEAEHFHDWCMANFGDIQSEVRAHPSHGMPMAHVDDIQNAMLQGSEKWKVAWVKLFGQPIANPFPTLTRAVAKHPEVFNVMISRLEPGAVLPPHKGPFRGVLRYHLGLEVPEGGLGLEVNGHTYRWKQGVGITFDDTLWHRAWNNTPHDRVVIFADVLRDLPASLAERRDILLEDLTKSEGFAKIVGSIRGGTNE